MTIPNCGEDNLKLTANNAAIAIDRKWKSSTAGLLHMIWATNPSREANAGGSAGYHHPCPAGIAPINDPCWAGVC
eukprot:6460269-Amphidinium_carterae.1